MSRCSGREAGRDSPGRWATSRFGPKFDAFRGSNSANQEQRHHQRRRGHGIHYNIRETSTNLLALALVKLLMVAMQAMLSLVARTQVT